jgi:hypothetical protein
MDANLLHGVRRNVAVRRTVRVCASVDAQTRVARGRARVRFSQQKFSTRFRELFGCGRTEAPTLRISAICWSQLFANDPAQIPSFGFFPLLG